MNERLLTINKIKLGAVIVLLLAIAVIRSFA
jgi:hypothetical protein